MKIVAIIQARMGSTRLPGKVMKEVLGKPLLEYQIERVRKSKFINQIVIATTTRTIEQPIIDLCERLTLDYYRGSEADVLSRYFEAATHYKADVVVRITSDCPLIDPAIIDQTINKYLSNTNTYDYISNTLERTFPIGLDVEVFSMSALKQSNREAKASAEREHVTPYIYLHPETFNLGVVKHTTNLSTLRLTVDTEEDLQLISRIIKSLYEKKKEYFDLKDIIQLLQDKPEWILLNSSIKQKELFPQKTIPLETEE